MCGEVAQFLCVERLCHFSLSLTHSGCLIYFCGVFFLQNGCVIFVERSGDLLYEEVALFFCVKRLHDFLCEEVFLRKKSFLMKTVFWWEKKFF